MPHHPKPFYRTARNAWFVQIGNRQIKLSADRDDAFARYHELMTKSLHEVKPNPIGPPLVIVIVDDFLDWCQKNRAPDTYRWYKDRLESFCKSIDAALTVDQLRRQHVQKWVDNYGEGIASGTKRNLISSIKRAMKWAEENDYIERSPIANLKKPRCGRKELILTPEQYRALLDRTKDQEFKDLVTVTWETGCRPQESLHVEARHVDAAGNRWVFPPSESKGQKLPRVVYLTAKALEITKRMIAKHPAGPLFRNVDGLPWTPDATNCRFRRAKNKVGVKVSLYSLRHTWINRMLLAGVDAFTVAHMAGHSDPSMLAKHYAHLSQAPGYLLQQISKLAG